MHERRFPFTILYNDETKDYCENLVQCCVDKAIASMTVPAQIPGQWRNMKACDFGEN